MGSKRLGLRVTESDLGGTKEALLLATARLSRFGSHRHSLTSTVARAQGT